MIKKSFIAFAIILLLHIVVRDVLKPNVEITQVPWQANQQIGQRYLYDPNNSNNVVVGSSMSFHLDFAGTTDSIINLALTGESPHRGLELVIARGKMWGNYPKNIFIEVNTLDNYGTSIFNETIYNPFLIYPRKYIPSLRDGKQPLPWMATIAEKSIIPYIIPNKLTAFENYLRIDTPLENKSTKEDFAPNEIMKAIDLSEKQKSEMEKHFTSLVNTLLAKRCNITFYETPVNEKNRTSKKYAAIREMIERNYPADQYPYIRNPLKLNFQTYDGIHISAKDNPKYSAYLRAAIDSLSCKTQN